MPEYVRKTNDSTPLKIKRSELIEMMGQEITDLAAKNPSAVPQMVKLSELLKLDKRITYYVAKGAASASEAVKGGYASEFRPDPSFLDKIIAFRDRQKQPEMAEVTKLISTDECREQLYPLLEFVGILMGDRLPHLARKPEQFNSIHLMAVKGMIGEKLSSSPYKLLKR